MKKKFAVLVSSLTLSLVLAMNRTMGIVPALGPFLSPFEGFWRNEELSNAFQSEELALEGLQQPVQIRFDQFRIPHLFAQNDHDLYYAQGYLTAQDRLWQMDFMTRAAAGRLSEVIGDRTLPMDRYQRRIGMVTAAQTSLQALTKDPQSKAIIDAYTAGVNAYIGQLSPRDYPFEFKLLHYAPEPWSNLKIALLLKMLVADMTGYSDDLRMTNTLRQYGSEVVKDLFPDYPFREEPIMPAGSPLDFDALPVPPTPADFLAGTAAHQLERQKPENLGSNNWAIAGSKTASGFPLLASDPHLTLSLPSIWYAIQLHAPGVNTYGVIIPGAPGVGIGFNEHIAWGITNVGADVMDWYEVKFKDNTRQQYWHDNQWKPVRRVVEKIEVKGGQTILDTVLYTHHGPVAYLPQEKPYRSSVTPIGHALRWIDHEAGNEVNTLHNLNRAQNYAQFRQALTSWVAPAFNFAFADAQNIAIVSNGQYPLKWPQQGKYLLDGTNPAYDWHGWVPMNQVPHLLNPARGYVSSANQSPVSPEYPYYLGSSFAGYERGARINQRLAAMTQATPDSFRLLQTDNLNLTAQTVLPTLLKLMDQSKLSVSQKKALALVSQWNYQHEADKIAPTIYEEWWQRLAQNIWADEFPADKLKAPARDRTVQMLLHEPTARWYDNINTPQKETLTQLVNLSFRQTLDSLTAQYGPMNNPSWMWGHHKNSSIGHLAQLPGFGQKLFASGHGNAINALYGSHGPSWRMVVQLGPLLKAYGVYPGGQSGNPGSPFYDNLLEDWRLGKLHDLLFLRSVGDLPSTTPTIWTLNTK